MSAGAVEGLFAFSSLSGKVSFRAGLTRTLSLIFGEGAGSVGASGSAAGIVVGGLEEGYDVRGSSVPGQSCHIVG